jgi:hypothetical protein
MGGGWRVYNILFCGKQSVWISHAALAWYDHPGFVLNRPVSGAPNTRLGLKGAYISVTWKTISKKIQKPVDRPAHPPYMPLNQDGVAGFSGT